MDVIRTELLRIADDISLALQNAARSFAFYSDGRDLVRLRETESGLLGEFPDHADEGWPALAFQLPPDAAFQRASSGFLTRNAFFTSAYSVAELERRFAESGITVRHRSGSGWSASLGDEAVMKVTGPRSHFRVASPASAILIEQRRTPDAIGEALQGLAARQPGPA
jgi:hypothetical protein